MTFYDIDGTPYGPKEYAADKMVVMQAENQGGYIPYDVKRRVHDYEMGWNPFDRKYEKKYEREYKGKGEESNVFGVIWNSLGAAVFLFVISVVIGGIVSLVKNGTPTGYFFGNIFPFIVPALYIIYKLIRWIINEISR